MGLAGQVRRLVLTLAVGAAGGAGFAAVGWPAAWLMGAMVATAIVALSGVRLGLPGRVRDFAYVLLGISIGSNVTPESLGQVGAWPGSIAFLVLSVAATMLASALYLEKVHGWDRTTARFASMPGAFSAVAVIALDSDADLPRVVLAQSLRIFVLVVLIPPILLLLTGAGDSAVTGLAGPATNTASEALLTLGVSAAAAGLLGWLRVPAGVLLGAMLASAVLHVTGLVHGRFPPALIIAGFVATGSVIGTRFYGTRMETVARTIPAAVVSVLVALAISAGIAAIGAHVLGLPFGEVWLAYAPGGVEAMAAMALSLGLDPAFVGAHHVLRILGLNLVSSLWLTGGRSRRG